ncbi:TetR family transcriptional regulator [Herbiconiux liukaitaii]|uniref:TetR family transcriptional regulator n=1 Tax=Herbiconiux liukaitaii TaxID=3342799 RepID=UPI0035B92D29
MDTAGTRQRILDAAVAEFAEYGFAGARVDRIASVARANKERIYAYFGDKQELFRTAVRVAAAQANLLTSDLATELPRAAGDLFDAAISNPPVVRLLSWARLEGSLQVGDDDLDEYRNKLGQIRAGQEAGVIDPGWEPADLLAIVRALASTWSSAPPGLRQLAESTGPDVGGRRSVIEDAIRRLAAPQ